MFKKFNAWSAQGKWLRIFNAVVCELDIEWVFINDNYVKAHQHSSRAAKNQPSAIGKSRAGNTSKIHLAADAYGLPLKFTITGGEIHDSTAAPNLIGLLPTDTKIIIGYKGYDSHKIHEQIADRGAKSIIPRKKNSVIGNGDIDWHLYQYRHLVENALARLKHFRGVATRYDKLKRNYLSVISMAYCYLWLPM